MSSINNNDTIYDENGNKLTSKAAWDLALYEFQEKQEAFLKPAATK